MNLVSDLDKQKQADLELFENDIEESAKKWKDHKKKQFTFTGLEQQMLAEQDTIIALAERTKLKVLNEISIRRIGLEPNPTIKLRYHVGLGRFVVFIPKKV